MGKTSKVGLIFIILQKNYPYNAFYIVSKQAITYLEILLSDKNTKYNYQYF